MAIEITNNVFDLRTHRSRYVFEVREGGRVVHLGSGAGVGNFEINQPRLYEDPAYHWNAGGPRDELPTFGDVIQGDVALKVTFPTATPASGETMHVPVRDVRLRYRSHEIRTDAEPALTAKHPQRARKTKTPRQTLVVYLKDEVYDFHARLFYRVTPEYDVIERWIEIENRTVEAVEVEMLGFGCVHLPVGAYDLIHAAGTWGREFMPVRRPIQQGMITLAQRGINTGHTFNPFYLIAERGITTEEAGPAHFGALAYSGNWQWNVECEPTNAVHIVGGYERGDGQFTLAPGLIHTTPAFVHGVAHDGLGGASRRLHGFARDYILPANDGPRPVLYNSWEATYFDVTVDGQIALARAAAELGVELYCIDDGWFGARRSDRAGLGDWVVSRDQFPNGLTPLIDEVKRLGMRFGLWVEPEMVNPDSDLYRAHPDWILHFPGRPRTQSRNQYVLDLGRREVVDFITQMLDRLLQENDISFFKWDMNRPASEPGSVAGREIWRRHVDGLYGILDHLRTRHPKLEIQSCSGGGGRVDLGVLQRTDQAWASDNTDAIDRAWIEDGYSLAYPPRTMESWVTHDKNHQTGRLLPLDVRFDCAMRGALGIGTKIDQLTDDERVAYKRKIAFYKQIRHVTQNGRLHRLTGAISDSGVSAWQFVSDDGVESVYSIIVTTQKQGEFVPNYRLRGLVPDRTYRALDEHGKTLFELSGGQLMTLGMPGDGRYGGLTCTIRSRTVYLKAV